MKCQPIAHQLHNPWPGSRIPFIIPGTTCKCTHFSICSKKKNCKQSDDILRPVSDFDSSIVATKRMVPEPSLTSAGKDCKTTSDMEPSCLALCTGVSSGTRDDKANTWKLFSDSAERQTFVRTIQLRLHPMSESLQPSTTRQIGLPSAIDVMAGVSPHARPLFSRVEQEPKGVNLAGKGTNFHTMVLGMVPNVRN